MSVVVGSPTGPVRVGPVRRDETSMPAQDGLGPNEEDRPVVTAEHASERAQHGAVFGREARAGDLSLQPRELVAQYEDLDIL